MCLTPFFTSYGQLVTLSCKNSRIIATYLQFGAIQSNILLDLQDTSKIMVLLQDKRPVCLYSVFEQICSVIATPCKRPLSIKISLAANLDAATTPATYKPCTLVSIDSLTIGAAVSS